MRERLEKAWKSLNLDLGKIKLTITDIPQVSRFCFMLARPDPEAEFGFYISQMDCDACDDTQLKALLLRKYEAARKALDER